MKENTMYNKAFCNNAASVLLYKSNRKNAKCTDFININHLINHEKDRRVNDERILQQLAGTVETIVYNSLAFNKHLEFKCFMHTFKAVSYRNANNEIYHTVEDINVDRARNKYSSIKQVINEVFDIYALIYPYNEISRKTVFDNPSIKYFINMYYNGGVENENLC